MSLSKIFSLDFYICIRCHEEHGKKFSMIYESGFSCVHKKRSYEAVYKFNYPPDNCDYYCEHFKDYRLMHERKGRMKKKVKDIRIAVNICKACRKYQNENNLMPWNRHDETLWRDYKYVRCAFIKTNDLDGAAGPEFIDGTKPAPTNCPYAMEHLICCKKNCIPV